MFFDDDIAIKFGGEYVNPFNYIGEEYKSVATTKSVLFKTVPNNEGLDKILKPFASLDILRLMFTGANFSNDGVCATDAHKLIFIKRRESSENGTYCLTKKCFGNTSEGDIETKSQKYPDYKEIIPKGGIEVEFDHNALLVYLNTMIEYKLTSVVTQQVVLTIGDFKIGFNASFLKTGIEGLLRLGYKELKFAYTTNNKAILILPRFNEGKASDLMCDFALIMPVMIESAMSKYSTFDIATYDLLTEEVSAYGTPEVVRIGTRSPSKKKNETSVDSQSKEKLTKAIKTMRLLLKQTKNDNIEKGIKVLEILLKRL